MSNNTTKDTTSEQIIKQVINAWTVQNERVTKFFTKYDESDYLEEVAPGRNRAVYLLGHLTATSDSLLPLLGLGERLYPQLEALFLTSPDRTFDEIPTVAELKQYWATISATLAERFAALQPEEWLERHTSVSAEDFAANPLRNRLNVLISRTIHIGYHAGQLTFLKQKEPA
jgi:hypothetical protein